MSYKLYDEFAGYGGSTTGAAAVPGVEPFLAANHNRNAVAVHSLNYPQVEHFEGDIAKADIAKFPPCHIFWASPACPPWTDAAGQKRDFDQSTQGVLFDPATGPRALDPKVARARALMQEIPRYLQAMRRKGRPVLAGVVENVVQVVKWDQFPAWRRSIEAEGYRSRLVALNAMHVTGPVHGKVGQSRGRFFLVYWPVELDREPDWDKWLRPRAYCPTCDQLVDALQVFKKPRTTMGVYGIRTGQYVYRCPNRSCRHQVIEPAVLPASEVIDWTLDPGPRIGDRVDAGLEPLVPATLERIEAGLTRYADVLLDPAGDVTPLARSFVSVLRGGGSKRTGYLTDRPIPTVSAQGNHHAVVGTPAAAAERALLLAYYSNGGPARPLNQPIGTLTTRDRFALVGQPPPDQHMLVRNYSSRGAGGEMCTPVNEPARTITTRGHQSVVGWRPDRAVVDQCTFRMLAQREIGDFMGFPSGYRVRGSDKDVKRGYGNAVPPAMAEVLVSALVEALSGEQLDPAA